MSAYDIDTQHQIDSAANLLAASVSGLALCSTAAVHSIEKVLEEAFSSATPVQIKAVYDAVHAAFSEADNRDEEIIL